MGSWVSSKLEIKHSDKSGFGYFVISPVAKGELLIVQSGIILTENDLDPGQKYEKYAYHCFQVERGQYICPISLENNELDGIFRVNHSCDPNCGFKGQISLIAIRDIQIGEEVTYDYAMTDVGSEELGWDNMKCLCGSKSCRKVIKYDDWKLPVLRKKYKEYFSDYIKDLIKKN